MSTNGTNSEVNGLSETEFFEKAFAAAHENNAAAKRELQKTEIVAENPVNPVPVEPKEQVAPKDSGVKADNGTGGAEDAPLKDENGAKEPDPINLESGETAEKPSESTPEPTVEQLKQEVEYLKLELHKAKSNAGRISAYQRQIADLKGQLALLQASQPPAQAAGKERKAPAYAENPKFKKIKDADPDLAEALEAILTDQEKDLKEHYEERVKPVVNAQVTASREQYVRQQQQTLREWVPNLDTEIIPSPQFQYFYKNASNGVRVLLESEEAEDVLEGLRLYDSWLTSQATKPAEPTKPKEESAKPKAPPVAASSAVDISKLNDSRSRRLAATDVSGSQQVTLAVSEDDEDSLFEKAFAETTRRLTPQPLTRR